jgi:hypothetical protein
LRAVCSWRNTTRLSFVNRFTASRTPGRPKRFAGVAHASTTEHSPRSTGVLSSSWIENAVSRPTGRVASVATKNVESSQKRWNVATNCSTFEHRVATHSAFCFGFASVISRPKADLIVRGSVGREPLDRARGACVFVSPCRGVRRSVRPRSPRSSRAIR